MLKITTHQRVRASGLCVFALSVFLSLPAYAIYDSGSSGALGDLILDDSKSEISIPLPPDGVLHYKNVNIPAGVTVTFERNAENTQVVLLASGDVIIDGTIDVSGQIAGTCKKEFQKFASKCPGLAGPGGFDMPFPKQSPHPLDGSLTDGQKYGDPARLNLVGGSGYFAVNQNKGGGGGGALTIASSGSIVFNGQILSQPGSNVSYGGKIRLVADVITGGGTAIAAVPDTGGTQGAGIIKFEAFEHTGSFALKAEPEPLLATPQVALPYKANKRPRIVIKSIDGQTPSGTLGQLPPDVMLVRGKLLKAEIVTEHIPVGTVLKFAYNPVADTYQLLDTEPVEGTFEQGSTSVTFTIGSNAKLGSVQAWAPAIPIP